MRTKFLILTMLVTLAFAISATAATARPLFWTINSGDGILPPDPPIPMHWTHCTQGYCVGKMMPLDGHTYKWLMGRMPVYRLKLTP